MNPQHLSAHHWSALYLRENLVRGPAAKMRGSLVWCSVSITRRRSKTRHASFMAGGRECVWGGECLCVLCARAYTITAMFISTGKIKTKPT